MFFSQTSKSVMGTSLKSQPVQQERSAVCLANFSMYLNKLSLNKTKNFLVHL